MLLMGKSTISMAIFNSYVKLPEGIYLVGGVEHVLWLSIYWAVHNPNWRTHIFRGVEPTNQYIYYIYIYILIVYIVIDMYIYIYI